LTLDRAVGYYPQHFVHQDGKKVRQARVKTITHDLHSIGDHATVLSGKITLLLDATLGMIGIEQNAIIKIFSVAAVIFLPPMVVASLYGMNFKFMPELGWLLGYPFAIGLMILSAVLPYRFFKRKGWL
jgi:magnesium transporter